MTDIGFLGLGIMGAPMAGHLMDGGHNVPHGSAQDTGAEGACQQGVWRSSVRPRRSRRRSEVIILMVPDTPQVETVLFGEDGVAAGLEKGKVVIDMSSIAPMATKDFAKRINDLGCDYLDAPVSGGEVGAKNAALTIMVGGEQAVFDKIKPIFDLMGQNITLVGGNGDGQTCKGGQPDHRCLEHRGGVGGLVVCVESGCGPRRRFARR